MTKQLDKINSILEKMEEINSLSEQQKKLPAKES